MKAHSPCKKTINPGEVHVWLISLEGLPLEGMIDIMDRHERERAAMFYDDADSRRYIAAHAMQRRILSAYTGIGPEKVRYTHGTYGKPMLDVPGGRLCFNLSHSGSMAAIALAESMEIGIDIEQMRSGLSPEELAGSLSKDEMEALRKDGSPAAFYRLWTRKEAYLKATGEGLNGPLDSVPAFGLHEREFRNGQYTFIDLEPAPGYAGAVVARGDIQSVKLLQWPENEAE